MVIVILSFGDEETKDIYNGVNSKRARKKLDSTLWKKAQMKLDMIHKAYRLDDLKVPPNNKLEKLQKNLAGKYSIRINDQWRIVFSWDHDKKSASDVTIMDYH
jgi:toxin HigB-1